MKRIILFTVSLLTSFCSATAGVYIVPTTTSPWDFPRVKVMVDHQGPFTVELDTGSDTFMVPGNKRICPSCKTRMGLAPSGPLGREFHSNYDGGSRLIAHQYRTTVQMVDKEHTAKTPVVMQTVGLIVSANSQGGSPIMGMAQPVHPKQGDTTTYMEALMNEHHVSSLAFMLVGCPHPHKGTRLVLGGIDPRLSHQKPKTVPILPHKPHYDITPVSIGISGSSAILGHFGLDVSVDSGTTEIGLPARLYVPVINALKKRTHLPDSFWKRKGTRLTSQQIASLPALVVHFANNITLSVPARSYVIPDPRKKSLKLLMIKNFGKRKYTVFGATFLSAFAVEFNRSQNTLSFYSNHGLCRR